MGANGEGLARRLRAEMRSVRARVLATMLAFMATGLVVAGTVTHAIQLNQLSDRVTGELLQEVSALQALATAGPDDGTLRPYSAVNELFPAFIRSRASGAYESILMIVDGRAAYVPKGQRTSNAQVQQLLDAAKQSAAPGQTVLRGIELDGSTHRLAIVSVNIEGDPTRGIMVVANDLGDQRDGIFSSLRLFALVSLVTILLAGVVGFLLTGRLLAPVKRLREATASVTSEELTQRVAVPDSHDDVSQLAANFNRMLDRLAEGFSDQRRFLDDAGHELRTPLTIVRGHLELLDAADADDVAQTRYVVLDEVDRMQRLVDDLLVLAKAQRPDFLRLGWMELDHFLNDLLDRITLLGNRNWTIDDSVTGRVWADRQRLTQAVVQLAANAVKFTSGGDTIAVGAAWAAPPAAMSGGRSTPVNRVLELWVRDGGAGIADEDQERIFERFGRAGAGRSVEGSGLGLSIVLAIVQTHGGMVTVDSQLRHGSTFTLWIPAANPRAVDGSAAGREGRACPAY